MVKRKQKRWSLANRPKPSGARYAPGTFPIDDQHVMETLLGIPADRLPTSGGYVNPIRPHADDLNWPHLALRS